MPHSHPVSSSRFVVAMLMTCLLTSVAAAESWTDLNNTRTIEAKMLGLWNDSVVLLLDDGRRVTVNLANLKAESRIQAKNLAEEQKRFRSGVVGEIKGRAQAAAAPAPTPLPKPPAAPAYVMPKANTPIIEHLRLVDAQSRAGHIIANFDALPPSYQKDISDLAKLGAQKINVSSWQGLMGSIHKIGDVIVTRQNWVFSHPRLEAMGPDAEPIEDVVLLFAGLLRDGFDPTAMDLNQFESMPFREWLLDRNQAIAPYLAELSELAGSMNQQSFELVSEDGDIAKVKATVGQLSVTIDYTRVEGFWVPSELVESWPDMMTKARESIEQTPNGTLMSDPMTSMIPAMIQPVIQPLATARDAKGFHAAMETLFAQAQPAVSSMAQLAGMNMPGSRTRGGSRGGYDEGMEDMYDSMEDMGDYEEQMRGPPGGSSGPPAGGRGGSFGGPSSGSSAPLSRGGGKSFGGPSGGSSAPPGGGKSFGPPGSGSSGPPGGSGSSAPPAGGSSRGPASGYGGSSSPNPNIGARLEDDMRRRNQDQSRQMNRQ